MPTLPMSTLDPTTPRAALAAMPTLPMSTLDPTTPRTTGRASFQPGGMSPTSTMDLMTPRTSIVRSTGVTIVERQREASKILGAAEIEKLVSRKKGPVNRSVVRPETGVTVTKQTAALVYCGFDQVGRQELKKHQMMRVSADPDKLQGAELLPQPHGTADLEDDVCESDDELLARCGYEEFQTEDSVEIPQALASAPGVRVGFGAIGTDIQQDRLFVSKCAGLLLVGLVNCHGKQSVCAELASLAASELPKAIFRSSALTRQKDATRALSDAFCRLHRLAAEQLDVRLTGASVTVVLVDAENIWVAHVGDCRAVLGVPDHLPNAEDFHFNPVALTQDHRLAVKQEFDRVQSCGGELRKMVKDNVYRLFVKDTEAPGLSLTRQIGHRMGHLVGVSHFPSVAAIRRCDLADGAFLILGSGALWTMMSERTAVNWVSRSYGDPVAAAESLSQQAASRWQDASHPAKHPLNQDVDDCFSVAVLLLDHPQEVRPRAASRARSFTLGQHVLHSPKKDFSEVKSLDRASRMRRVQANYRPLTEDVILRQRDTLEQDIHPFARTA